MIGGVKGRRSGYKIIAAICHKYTHLDVAIFAHTRPLVDAVVGEVEAGKHGEGGGNVGAKGADEKRGNNAEGCT